LDSKKILSDHLCFLHMLGYSMLLGVRCMLEI